MSHQSEYLPKTKISYRPGYGGERIIFHAKIKESKSHFGRSSAVYIGGRILGRVHVFTPAASSRRKVLGGNRCHDG